MSGLMRRLTRARAATDDEAAPQAPAPSDPVDRANDAQQGGVAVPANGTAAAPQPVAPEEPRTQVLDPAAAAAAAAAPGPDAPTAVDPAAAAVTPGRDLPAGVDPAELNAVPTGGGRGRLRRRLRYLRAVREVLLRDLGGFYLEAHRSEQGVDAHKRLLDAKSARLTTLGDEVRELETRLGEPHPPAVLRVPGIGGTCPRCGELHASDARFCSRCGTSLDGRADRAATIGSAPTGRAATTSPAVAARASADDPKATTAALWGRPKHPVSPPPQAAAATGDAAAAPAAPSAPEAPTAPEGSKDPASPHSPTSRNGGEPA
jgi:hypothetical protein